jgi:hypothetical protein
MNRYIFLKHGLANRIRTIIGYIFIGLETDQEFTFIWETGSAACNGNFNDLFEPIMIKSYKSNYGVINKVINIIDAPYSNTINYYFDGQDTIHAIIEREAVYLLKNQPNDYIKKIEMSFYKYIASKQHITQKVCEMIQPDAAMHIRRTDHIDCAKSASKFSEDIEFHNFVKKNKDKKIFLATDCHKVQNIFLRYNNVYVYKKIVPTKNLRQTSLEDALIDILIAARAHIFKGSGYSSYSRLIEIFKTLS